MRFRLKNETALSTIKTHDQNEAARSATSTVAPQAAKARITENGSEKKLADTDEFEQLPVERASFDHADDLPGQTDLACEDDVIAEDQVLAAARKQFLLLVFGEP